VNIQEYGYNVIDKFKTLYPDAVNAMKNSDHSGPGFKSKWHLEGDVWTHTMMVVSQIYAEYEGNWEIDTHFKRMFIAALLHDVGKPMSRVVQEDGRVNFNGHDGAGTIIAHKMIFELDNTLTYEDKIYILKLINYHQVLFSVDKKAGNKAIEKLSAKFVGDYWLLEDVAILRNADYLGNISDCADNVNYEKINTIKFNIQRSKKEQPKNGAPFMNVLVGLPCSGKDTYLENEWFKAKSVSRDDILMKYANGDSYSVAFRNVDQKMVDKEFAETFEQYIKEGESFFVNRTNLTHKGRMKFINRAKQAGFNIKVTVFLTDWEIICKRNDNRTGKIIPDFVFNNMMKLFDMPFSNEGEVNYLFDYSKGEKNV